MYEQHRATTLIYAYEPDPTKSVHDQVTVTVGTDKREEGYHNTASLALSVQDRDYPRSVTAQMTASEWETLAAAATLQASILRGGVGR